MSQLPKGWVESRLGDVLELVNGRAYKKHEMLEDSDALNVVPILRIQNLNGGNNWFYSDLDLPENKYCYKGDLLFAWSATFGPYWARWDKTIFHYHIWNVKPSKAITKRFAYYTLCNITAAIKSAAHGVAMPHMTKSGMESWPIALPSVTEQTRIVEKLDEVLAQVDTIKARLDGIPAILKRFRQSVLAAAVSGKLTEEWRGECDYIENSLGEGWKWGAMPSNWTAKFYPELVDSRLGKMLDKNKNVGKATKYLGNINVRWFGTDLSNVQEILVSDKEQEELSLSKGDVLICEGGEPGRCCVWSKDSDEVIVFQKALHRARVKKEMVSEWLVYNLKNDADGLILNQLFTGTTIKHLTGKALKNYPIRVPPIEEQKEIVRLVDQYFAFADTIEAQVKKAQARVDKLTQSILAKAFRGELVPQDPSDEPADKLLERIAAARKEAEALAKAAKKATNL